MKKNDKYTICFLGLYFLICLIGFVPTGSVSENYNICFRAQIVSPIFISNLCVIISNRFALINDSIFVIRMGKKNEIVLYCVYELLKVVLEFTLITNLMAIASLFPANGMSVLRVENIVFYARSFVKQFWGWNLVGACYLLTYFATNNRVVSSMTVLVMFEILSMSNSMLISYKDYLYNFPGSIIVNMEDKLVDINQMFHNVMIGMIVIWVCSRINIHRAMYGTRE